MQSPQQPSTSASCAEKAGFLFAHPCANPATLTCEECGKTVCDLHSATLESRVICMTCLKKRDLKPGNAGPVDPYHPCWYSMWYYAGYGYFGPEYWGNAYLGGQGSAPQDGNDFTEADSAAVEAQDDAAFEMEIGGS